MSTTKTTASISQHKLRKFEELKAAAAEFEAMKKELIAELDAGATCQLGRLSVVVEETSTTSIAWKAKFIEVAGKDAADEINRVEKGNSTRRKLVLAERKSGGRK